MSDHGPLWSGEDPARKAPAPPSSQPAEAPAGWLPPTDAPPPPEAITAPPPPPPPTEPQWHPPEASAAPAWGPGPGVLAAAGRPAEFNTRAGAAAIDFLVRLAIILACLAVGSIAYVAGEESGETGVAVAQIVGFVFSLAYAPIMIARTGGQTVGHRATHTRIVRRDGSALTGGQAATREVLVKGVLFEGLSVLLAFVPTLLNYLWPLWDENKEALHDKLCKTRVIHD